MKPMGFARSLHKNDPPSFRDDKTSVLKILKTVVVLRGSVSKALQQMMPALIARGIPLVDSQNNRTRRLDEHDRELKDWIYEQDPTFRLCDAFKRFEDEALKEAQDLIMDSCRLTQKLVDLCLMETEIFLLCRAMGDTLNDNLLKNFVRRIAADELRIYRLLQGLLLQTPVDTVPGFFSRMCASFECLRLKPNNEMVTAYFVANTPKGAVLHLDFYRDAYRERSLQCYKKRHFYQKVQMVLRILNLHPPVLLRVLIQKSMWWVVSHKRSKNHAIV